MAAVVMWSTSAGVRVTERAPRFSLEAGELGGAGDGDDLAAAAGVLGEEPGECDLGGGGVLVAGDGFEQVDEGAVGLHGVGGEAGEGAAEVVAGERCGLVDFACEEAFAEGAVGDEADAELFEGRDDLGFGAAPPEGVLVLEGGDGLDGVGAADGLDAGFGEAEVLDLAFGDELLDGAGDVFDGDLGVDAVLVEEIDVVGLEALE